MLVGEGRKEYSQMKRREKQVSNEAGLGDVKMQLFANNTHGETLNIIQGAHLHDSTRST